ncbi:TRAP transporter large permease [Desulfovibrio desulfuricans]|uniref:TRAP transporter large permease n=1 Tax=Desulfovibrio desulfuricans TaxID=876 RepID=A0A4P7UG96_DESDE|nr:TRAP transporter large permease [Desulfovibrio desulfuricans]QCC84327.1 TRAP transporter large permease [Desulfovibrio desulfuricans]
MDALLHDPAFWLLTLFLVPLLFRVPIALALGFSALFVVWKWDMGVSMLSYNFFAGIAKFPLLAIPFFILAGYIMERAGIAARIVALMEALVGSMTGGLAVATVAVATFWGAVSGSGPATVAALGLILIPGMAKAGYDKAFATATVSVTSGLAIVIPPSIAFIVYGGVADVSVPALFAAGFVPGIVVAFFIMGAVLLISRKRGYKGKPRQQPVGKALREAFWGIMTPVVILGGIYGGVFTPTEAAAVAIFYGLFVGVFIYRTINSLEIIIEILTETAKATAIVMIVVTCAGLYSWVGSAVGLVEKCSGVLLGMSNTPWIVLLMINIILLIAGMLLDAISIYYVFLPFMLPIVSHFQWDPVWFGIMMTINLAVGQVTPPVAVNLYVGAKISGLTMEQISKEALPLIGAALLALAVITAFPSITTFVPKFLGLY